MRHAVPPTAALSVVCSDLGARRGARVLREVLAAFKPPAIKLHSMTWEMFSSAEAARGQGLGLSPENKAWGPLAPREPFGKVAFGESLLSVESNQSCFCVCQYQLWALKQAAPSL